MDYGKSPGNPTPLVEDARPAILQVFSFHLWIPLQPPFSNYHFWLAAGFLSKIHLICSAVKGLERKLVNYLLLLTLRKQRLRALRCLFPKLNGVSGHSCAFLSLNSQKRMKELSIWNNLYNLYSR